MPDTNAFDAILFDVGGVLLTNGWDHNERHAVYTGFGLAEDAIHAIETRHPKPYDLFERDMLTLEDYLGEVVFFTPRSFSPREFADAMRAQSVLFPGNAMAVLRELAARGSHLIGLLNNESRALHQYRMERFGISPLVDVQLSSCYLGLRKPEPAIYGRALDILGLAPERVVFIDDRALNANKAADLGIHAITFQSEPQLRDVLAALAIL